MILYNPVHQEQPSLEKSLEEQPSKPIQQEEPILEEQQSNNSEKKKRGRPRKKPKY